MALFSQLADDLPDIARAVADLEAFIGRDRGPQRPGPAPKALGYEIGIRPVAPSQSIAGVGAVVIGDRDGEIRPAVFVAWAGAAILDERQLHPARRRSLREELGLLGAPDAEIVLTPRAAAQAEAGRAVKAPHDGTLGARVSVGGVDALLTAGHVAPILGYTAVSDGRPVGKVSFTTSPQSSPPGVASVDVAVLRLSPWFRDGGSPHATTAMAATLRMELTAYGAVSGKASAWVKGLARSYVGESDAHGDWSEVAVTMGSLSAGGDSGALVCAAGTNQPVGQVVGGAPGVQSLVQDLATQLDACGAVLR